MTRAGNKGSVVLDLRCLQDPNYSLRGIGRHVLALLRNVPRDRRVVGLIDPMLPALLPEAREAVDAVCVNGYAASRSGSPRDAAACFVMMSPMTHDTLFPARLLADPAVLCASIVHDFIPHRLPERYLPSAADRLNYAAALRWLARCDLFLATSRSSGNDLRALLGVPESVVAVTGCALDPAFERLAGGERRPPRHLLVVGGGDPRKNPVVVVRAHARSAVMQEGAGVPLVIAGNYGPHDAAAFRAAAAAAGGRGALVEVPGHVPDEQLLELYGGALAVVSPSYDEGFSIPVIEGMAAGAPCFASDIPAHAELVTDPACRFQPDDDVRLSLILERAADAEWRAAVLARQAGVWPRFRAGMVGARFWNAVARRLDSRSTPVLRGHRPRVALLSPVPPARSGVADYTAATCAELGKLVDLDVFTDTVDPAPLPNAATVRPLSALPHLASRFDRVVSVIGNSHFHVKIFEMLRRHGGACIAHDARMLGFYGILLGRERAVAVSSKELGRPVTEAELNGWFGDEGKTEALFLGEVAESAAPMIVHSAVTAGLLKQRHGAEPAYLPFSIYRPWTSEELMPAHRAAARARLGLEPAEVAIATFGFVHASKAPEECVWALEVMRGWGIPASLHFVGAFEGVNAASPGLRPLVAELGLERQVRFADGYVSEQMYRDYLIGADLAVQLRTYGLGGLSGGLLDCAAAGLPTVTNQSLGVAVGVPDYVRCIPDAISPLLLADALADLLASGIAAQRPEQARRAYSRERSFSAYARGLCRALELDASPAAFAGQVAAAA